MAAVPVRMERRASALVHTPNTSRWSVEGFWTRWRHVFVHCSPCWLWNKHIFDVWCARPHQLPTARAATVDCDAAGIFLCPRTDGRDSMVWGHCAHSRCHCGGAVQSSVCGVESSWTHEPQLVLSASHAAAASQRRRCAETHGGVIAGQRGHFCLDLGKEQSMQSIHCARAAHWRRKRISQLHRGRGVTLVVVGNAADVVLATVSI